jgi:hypothetical protein
VADKQSRLRVSVESNAKAAFDKMGRDASSMASKAGAAIKRGLKGGLDSGLKGAGNAMKDLGSTLKTGIKTVATFGGAFSFGTAIAQGMSLQKTYKNLAFAISAGTGQAVKWTDVQRDVEATAKRWSQTNADVAQSFGALFEETGDADFARKAVEEVALASRASGKDMSVLTGIVGTLNEKFGIGADAMRSTLATVLQMGNKGGVSIEDMSEKLGLVGATAKLVGIQGEEGFAQIVGMLNTADDVTGNFKKGLAAVNGVLEQMADPDKLKAMEKVLGGGIKLRDKKGMPTPDALSKIMQATGGKEGQLAKLFSGEPLKLITAFGKKYQAAFASTEGDVKAKTKAATMAFEKSLKESGKATLSAAKIEEEAKKNLEDPQARLNEAMNKMAAEFSKPQMIDALKKLAELLPKMAEKMAQLVDFAMKNPKLAAAMAGGAHVGLGALGEIGSGAMRGIGSGITRGIGSALAGGGKAFARAFMESATAGGGGPAAWGKTFASIAGPLVAAAIAFELGKAALDKAMGEDLGKVTDVEGASAVAKAATATKVSDESKRAAAKKLRDSIAASEAEMPTYATIGLSKIASAVTGGEVKDVVQRREETLAGAKKQLAELEASFGSSKKGSDDMAQAARQAAQELKKIKAPGAPDPSKGPMGGGEVKPGYGG